MGNIYEIIGRAVALQNKTDIGSITAEETGGIMADTLRYLNDYQLSASSIGLARIYSSLEDMQSDQQPTSDLNGMALKAGQLVVIVSESEDEAGKVYRYNGMPGNWTYVGIVGNDVIARNINEYNLSLIWPTDGSEGTNVYTKDLAVSLMTRKLSPSLLVAGISAVYLNAQGTSTVLRYTGGDSSSLASWMEVQDFTADASKKLSEAQPAVDKRLETKSKEIVGAINEIFKASGHQKQQSDWNETDSQSCSYIRNKPELIQSDTIKKIVVLTQEEYDAIDTPSETTL